MAVIRLERFIDAPIERCFDLSRSIDLHVTSMTDQGERAVGGRMSGLIELGEDVTWEARHFGVTQRLTSRITAFDRPFRFRDSMVRGAFQRFDHDHLFEQRDSRTLMTDVFDYTAPLGILGIVAERLFLTRYMTNLLSQRNEVIQRMAESDEWRRILEK
jgi:ligand-binding SRPBCC domain-containing protein